MPSSKTDNGTFVKIYRKIVKDDVLFGKTYDFGLFIYLIIIADYKTGIARVGRHSLAKRFRAKESTIYKAMKRLEKEQLINIKSNNQYSEVYIRNYEKYQGKSNNHKSNKVTTKEQQSNTYKEYKNKRINNNTYKSIENLTNDVLEEIANKYQVSTKTVLDLKDELELYCESKGKKYKNYKAALQVWLRKRIKEDPGLRMPKPPEKKVYDLDPDGLEKIRQLKKQYGLA